MMMRYSAWILFPALLGLCLGIPKAHARLEPETLFQIVEGFGYDSIGDSVVERYPYIASLRRPGPGQAQHLCGGALVAPAVVLTAARCVDPSVGGTNTSLEVHVSAGCKNCWLTQSQNVKVAKAVGTFLHPAWNNWGELDGPDMALVFLDEELPGPYLTVPAVAMVWTVVPNNHPLALVGYFAKTGTTRREVLKEMFLPYQSRKVCDQKYRAHPNAPEVPVDTFVCAGGSGYKVCMSDLGSPLILKGDTPEEDYAIGVLSSATTGSCWNDVSIPALFTSFGGFQEGIELIKTGGPKTADEPSNVTDLSPDDMSVSNATIKTDVPGLDYPDETSVVATASSADAMSVESPNQGP